MSQIRITTGTAERVDQAAALLSDAFANDPCIIYLLTTLSPEERASRRPSIFKTILESATKRQGGTIEEANDWQACGVLLPPDRLVPPKDPNVPSFRPRLIEQIGPGGAERMSRTEEQSDDGKENGLKEGEEHYYVYYLGTVESARGQGLCSAIVRRYQSIAETEDTPLYVETGNEYACRLYQKLGFETVGEFWIGKGEVGSDGNLQEGGFGVRNWKMIWRPGMSA